MQVSIILRSLSSRHDDKEVEEENEEGNMLVPSWNGAA